MVSILPSTAILKSSFFNPGAANKTWYSSFFFVIFTVGTLIEKVNDPSLSNHSFQGLKKSSNTDGIFSVFLSILVFPYYISFFLVINYCLKNKYNSNHRPKPRIMVSKKNENGQGIMVFKLR